VTVINGHCDTRFSGLKDAFASCFADGLEHGAGVAVMLDGRLVAELWGGHADKAKRKDWQRDTLVNVWSCTKGVVAAAVAMAVERGQLRYEAPIADVWPAFGCNGKEAISLDLVMSHRSGLNGFNDPVADADLESWERYTARLAQMSPNWVPGTVCAYHALSYGHLAGEPLRRVSGKSVGQFITEEIAEPSGVEFYVGVPETHDHRCAEMIEGPKASDWITTVSQSAYPQSVQNPTPRATAPNERKWRAVEIPGGNGHCSAAGLASIYGDMVSGRSKLMSVDALQEASRERYRGLDASFGSDTCWGAGFRLDNAESTQRASKGTISHSGWGGSIGLGDPVARLGFAYVTNYMLGFDDGIDLRRKRLLDAVYDAL
jgi:CubicO group peptidase (beta-lactamase class C family)